MKKLLFLVATIIFATASGQNLEDNMQDANITSVGLVYKIGNISGLGAFYENLFINKKSGKYSTVSLDVLTSKTELSNGEINIEGKGIETNIYFKSFTKGSKGLYYKSGVGYGNLKFDETITTISRFQGTYSYLSFFQPEIGYDIIIAKKLRLNLNIGTQWQIEIKGKGDIDNKTFDNWLTRGGARLSYDF